MGRGPSKGWVLVDRAGVADDADLRRSVERSTTYARTLRRSSRSIRRCRSAALGQRPADPTGLQPDLAQQPGQLALIPTKCSPRRRAARRRRAPCGTPRRSEHPEVADQRLETGREAGRRDHRVRARAAAVREVHPRPVHRLAWPPPPPPARTARPRRCRCRGSARSRCSRNWRVGVCRPRQPLRRQVRHPEPAQRRGERVHHRRRHPLQRDAEHLAGHPERVARTMLGGVRTESVTSPRRRAGRARSRWRSCPHRRRARLARRTTRARGSRRSAAGRR